MATSALHPIGRQAPEALQPLVVIPEIPPQVAEGRSMCGRCLPDIVLSRGQPAAVCHCCPDKLAISRRRVRAMLQHCRAMADRTVRPSARRSGALSRRARRRGATGGCSPACCQTGRQRPIPASPAPSVALLHSSPCRCVPLWSPWGLGFRV
eukprot:353544-Chlamydomonas_euryale.AAC.2